MKKLRHCQPMYNTLSNWKALRRVHTSAKQCRYRQACSRCANPNPNVPKCN